jgi:hypothetical protein
VTVRIDPLHIYEVHVHGRCTFDDGYSSRVPWDHVSVEFYPFAPVLTAQEPSLSNPTLCVYRWPPVCPGPRRRHAEAQFFSKMDLSVAETTSYVLLELVGYVLRVFLDDLR